MVLKVTGYVIAGLGILGLIASFEQIRAQVPAFSGISSNLLLTISIIFIVVGVAIVFIATRGVGKKLREIPIFEGRGKKRKVVAYQREK